MADLAGEIARRRTFAIISHPDAGKTTLTEKLLLFGGAIQMAGTAKGRKAARPSTPALTRPAQGRGIPVAPSSHSCDSPFCSAFIRSGSFSTARRKISGAKSGTPVKVSRSPWVKVSPMLMVPWL